MGYSIEHLPVSIGIGRETEAGVTEVRIDCTAWLDRWPGMAVTLIHCPYNGTPYMPVTRMDGPVLVWPVTDADTAAPGMGRAEVDGRLDGVHVVSAMVQVMVRSRMPGTVGEAPEPAKPWVDEVTGAAARAEGALEEIKDKLASGEFKGEPGKDGSDATVTEESVKAALGYTPADEADMPSKLTEPSSGLEVGKYFRIAALDENGHAVLEAVDAPVGGVQDVLVNGDSIVNDGVANMPIAKYGNYGIIRGISRDSSGFELSNGEIRAFSALRNDIDNRNSSRKQISPANFDYALEAGMCDGKGPAWAPERQAAARERMGIPSGYELIEEITLSESVDSVLRTREPDGTLYNLVNAFLSVYVPIQDSGYIPGTIWVYFRNYKNFNAGRLYISLSNTINRAVYMRAEQRTSNGIWLNAVGEFGEENMVSRRMNVYNVETENSNITCINIICSLPAGTIIQIYGVRA